MRLNVPCFFPQGLCMCVGGGVGGVGVHGIEVTDGAKTSV